MEIERALVDLIPGVIGGNSSTVTCRDDITLTDLPVCVTSSKVFFLGGESATKETAGFCSNGIGSLLSAKLTKACRLA
jgi:hypothetical protein